MKNMQTCENCHLWNLAPDDAFCSWCGHQMAFLQVGLSQELFSLDEIPPPVDLILTNLSSRSSIEIRSIKTSEPWVAVEDFGGPLLIEAEQSWHGTVTIDTMILGDDYHRAEITVDSTAGRSSVDLEVAPPPELVISTGEYEVFLDNRQTEQNLASVTLLRGMTTIEEITAKGKQLRNGRLDWVTVKLPNGLKLPLTLDARRQHSLVLKLEVDEQCLMDEAETYPATYSGDVIIRCREFERSEPFLVHCWKPPQLLLWEEHEPITAYAGKLGEVILTLQNLMPLDRAKGVGNATLEISKIKIENDDGSECKWLKPTDEMPDVIRIEAGSFRRIRFTFQTTESKSTTQEAIGIGKYGIRIFFTTNMPDAVRSYFFEVTVKQIPVFPGVLAIDFGTSNTCCAALDIFRADKPSLLSIDSPAHNPRPTTAPTIIGYLDLLATGERRYDVGAKVESMAVDPRVVSSIVRSPKRRLGGRRPEDFYEVRFFNRLEKTARLSACDVVTDYLLHLRSRAENQFKARFDKIVVTHPSRFRIHQIRDLKAAVLAAFGGHCEISTLQEPVAAAITFILSEEARKRGSYTLAVFDFGGGTTDISLLHVDITKDVFTEIHPRLLRSTGRWFGGEDLTNFILQDGLAKCINLAQESHPNAQISINPRDFLDINLRWPAFGNRAAMHRWAEETKLLLVEHGDDHHDYLPILPEIFPELKLALITSSGIVEERFPHKKIAPKLAAFHALLRRELESLAESLARLILTSKCDKLDYILLSGKSSAITLVRDVLAEKFPTAKFAHPGEPKECVVEGACLRQKAELSADFVLVFDDSGEVTTTSRIGIQSFAVFKQLIDVGVPIPKEGLVTALDNFPLRVTVPLRLLDNASVDVDNIQILGKENPDISEIGIYVLEAVPEGLPTNRPVPCRLELRLTQDFEVTLTAYVIGLDQPLKFRPVGNNG